MPPKKTGTAAPKKAAGTAPAHATYQDMIKDAIRNLKDRSGSSRQAIKKYIQANNNLGNTTDAAFSTHINRALTNGEKSGAFARPKGPSGPVKLAKPSEKPATKATSKPASKAAKPAKKAGDTKKATTKKATTGASKTKAAPKKATTKSTANASKSRKTGAAPAVDSKPAVVIGKTKSGRVTKSKAPATERKKVAPKKAAPKKATAKKA